MPRPRHTASLGALALLAACASDKGPSALLRVAEVATAAERCGGATARDGATLTSEVRNVRVTLRARAADGTTLQICDRVFDYGGNPAAFSVTAGGAAYIDLFAESFGARDPADPDSAGGVRRLATGSMIGIPRDRRTLPVVRLYPTERFTCAGARLAFPRAFHTATLLPDGRVLFVGGLVANAADPSMSRLPNPVTMPSTGVTATGAAEIYDPLDESLVAVDEATPPHGRAFHAAALLDGGGCPSGQVAVALVGGLGPVEAGKPILAVGKGLRGGRLVPQSRDNIPIPFAAKAVGNEILCLDAAAHTATRVPIVGTPAAFRAAGATADRLVVAGGIDYDQTLLNQIVPVSEVAVLPRRGAAVTAAVGLGRSGASLTPLDASTALVWGGGASGDPVGELVSGIDATPTSMPITVAGAVATEFHTATHLDRSGEPSVLVTGGFAVTSGGVNIQPPPAAQAVRIVSASGAPPQVVGFAGTFAADATCTNPARYRPAGWESAIALPRGRILVTGGSPATIASGGNCADCPDEQQALCAIGQAAVYAAKTGALVPALDPVSGDRIETIPRFGHTSTTLVDGRVLIAGGVGGDRSSGTTDPIFLTDLEIYNPHELLAPYAAGVDDDDPVKADLAAHAPPLRRAPGAQAIDPAAPDRPASPCDDL